MHSLRQVGIFISIVVVVCVPWDLLVLIALRMFGVPVKFGLGKEMRMNGALFRGLGKTKFVFIQGVLLWGWPLLAAQQIYHFVAGRPWATAGETAADVVGRLLIWSAAGVWFGLIMWNKSEPHLDPTQSAN